MSDVKADSAPPEAASPSHPQHARWVKERTLAMEIAHAERVGGSLRDAEDANMRSLDRLARRGREAPTSTQAPAPAGARADDPNIGHAARVAQRGVSRKVAPVLPAVGSPCNYCGQCLRCKRELRCSQILARAREGDTYALRLTHELVGAMFAFQARKDFKTQLGSVVPFSRMRLAGERNVALLGLASEICDRSVKLLGAWR